MMLAIYTALLTMGDAIRPTFFLDALKAGIIVREFLIELSDRIPEMFRYALLGLHGTNRLPERPTCCQGIISFHKH